MKPGSTTSSAGQRLLEELEKIVLPFAQAANTAVAYVSGQETLWLNSCRGCLCSWNDETVPANPGHSCQSERACHLINFGLGEASVGHLAVCHCRNDSGPPAAIEHLVSSIGHQIEMEQEQALLLAELSASWESLEAVYEISSDLDLLMKPQELLERIIHRAVSFRQGLKAVLWLEREGMLYPVAKGIADTGPRRKEGSLIEKVMAGRNGIILNSRSRILLQDGLEPELQNATNLALVPLTSRYNSFGVLAVWQEENPDDFDSHNMRFLAALALQAAMIVENDRLHRESLESERLRHEVEIGSKIQQTLLVGQVPGGFPGLKVAALTVPSQKIDGDFYDFIKPHDQCLDVISGDVMGKGIPAALVGAATKTHFLRAINQLLSSPTRLHPPEPYEIVTCVHDELVKQLIDLESFVTLCYARFDVERMQAQIVDCGHTRTVRYRRHTDACDLLKGVNLPIGFIEREVYEQASFELEPGDLYFFYSDGLTEATNEEGEPFGEERLVKLIRSSERLDPDELIAEVHRSLIAFAGSETFDDDLTCVAVRILETTPPGPFNKRHRLEFLSDLKNLGECRAFVRNICREAATSSVDEDFASQLELAVNEAVANVMKHAYAGRPDQPIQLTAEVSAEHITIQIRHRGTSFDPHAVPAPAFDGSKEDGFGLFILAQYVDEVSYASEEPGWNCTSLVKIISRENQNGSSA